MAFSKVTWQREMRRAFAEQRGYSTTADYGAGGLREAVLQRDGYACVVCGMADAEHKQKWGRPITIDHKDKNRSRNAMDNLQTLCLPCHGRKDLLPRLRVQRVPRHKEEIRTLRSRGWTLQAIADHFGFSIGIIHRWIHKWNSEVSR